MLFRLFPHAVVCVESKCKKESLQCPLSQEAFVFPVPLQPLLLTIPTMESDGHTSGLVHKCLDVQHDLFVAPLKDCQIRQLCASCSAYVGLLYFRKSLIFKAKMDIHFSLTPPIAVQRSMPLRAPYFGVSNCRFACARLDIGFAVSKLPISVC